MKSLINLSNIFLNKLIVSRRKIQRSLFELNLKVKMRRRFKVIIATSNQDMDDKMIMAIALELKKLWMRISILKKYGNIE